MTLSPADPATDLFVGHSKATSESQAVGILAQSSGKTWPTVLQGYSGTNFTWYFEHFLSVLFLYVSLHILSLLSLHLQKVKFRKGYYSCFVTICGTCMGKRWHRDNMASFASASTLHMGDFKTLFAISVGIMNNRSGPQFACWKFQQMRCN